MSLRRPGPTGADPRGLAWGAEDSWTSSAGKV